MDLPEIQAGSILKGSANVYPGRTAYLYRGEERTFSELYEEALQFASALQSLGIRKGDVVATHLPTCIQYPAVYYGILLSGAVYSPTNPYFPADELAFQLMDCGARAVITHEAIAAHIQSVLPKTDVKFAIVTGDSEIPMNGVPVDVSVYGEGWYSFAALKNSAPEKIDEPKIEPKEDLAHIAYTGGTTGRPKGVMLTHFNVVSNVLQSAAWSAACLPLVTEDNGLVVEPLEKDQRRFLEEYPNFPGTAVRLSPAPLHHGAGTIGGLVYAVLLGSTTVLFDRFNPAEFLEDIETHGVTELSGAPAMFNYLLRHPGIEKKNFSTVRTINSGAAPIAVEQMKQLQAYFPEAIITEGYGLTEATASTVQSIGFRSGLRKPATVGLPIYNTELKLIPVVPDEFTHPADGHGEVCVRGPQVMKGYYNNPLATEETLIDGWLHTGDIGAIDEDGFLAIVDRKKDMLLYKGYNVYPRKLEELLYEHPAVAAAAVIGKADPEVGEKPKAFVVRKQDLKVTEEELMQFVNEQVIHYAKLRELEFIEELPMTVAGKISKVMLMRQESAVRK